VDNFYSCKAVYFLLYLLQMSLLKEFWAKIPKETRSEIGRETAHKRWDKTSQEDTDKHIKKMNEARKNKQKIVL